MAKLTSPCIALCDSQMGLAETKIAKGTIGFIQEFRKENQVYVYWPFKKGHQFGVHPAADICGITQEELLELLV
jgi:hypothetical protein